MTRGLFVTGTETGVGKTVVAAAIVLALRRRGFRVGVMKPVESGCPRVDGRLVGQDARVLREASACQAAEEDVNPYALEAALAPALAAEHAHVDVDLARIQDSFGRIAESHEVVIVEGAGGLLTPLSASLTMRDLAVCLALPVVIVARNVLGAINHTALTVEAARGAGLEVLGVVLNSVGTEVDAAMATNAEGLRRWGGAPLLGHVPYSPAGDTEGLLVAGDALLEALSASSGLVAPLRISYVPEGPPPRGAVVVATAGLVPVPLAGGTEWQTRTELLKKLM